MNMTNKAYVPLTPLVNAASDLLAALKGMISMVDGHSISAKIAIDQARAAIAKTEGK